MNLLERIKCKQCHKRGVAIRALGEITPDICVKCRLKNYEMKKSVLYKDNFLANLKTLPIEERLARIEEWMYDKNIHL